MSDRTPRPILLNGKPLRGVELYHVLDMLAIDQAIKRHRRCKWINNAIASYFRETARGAQISFKASGGTAAITFASLANSTSDSTGGRQSVKADFESLGSATNTSAQIYAINATYKWLTTAPTSGNTIEHYINPSTSATAGTDNRGACAGTDSAYTGNANDISVSARQLIYGGSFVVSALADADQIGFIGLYRPTMRYASIVAWNKSGRLLHSTEGNQAVTFQPIEMTSDAS